MTITVNGFSKAYAMTGWRLGYLGAPEAIAKAIDSMQSHTTSNPCSFAQKEGLPLSKATSSASPTCATSSISGGSTCSTV